MSMTTQFVMKQAFAAVVILLSCGLISTCCSETPELTLVGWGIDATDINRFFADANSVGFDALITWSTDAEFLTEAVEAGNKHNIKVFSSLAPMGGMRDLWEQRYP